MTIPITTCGSKLSPNRSRRLSLRTASYVCAITAKRPLSARTAAAVQSPKLQPSAAACLYQRRRREVLEASASNPCVVPVAQIMRDIMKYMASCSGTAKTLVYCVPLFPWRPSSSFRASGRAANQFLPHLPQLCHVREERQQMAFLESFHIAQFTNLVKSKVNHLIKF